MSSYYILSFVNAFKNLHIQSTIEFYGRYIIHSLFRYFDKFSSVEKE